MADDQKFSGSQVAGMMIGAAVGNAKGSTLGMTAALAVAPLLGPFAPFALLLVPAGTVVGTVAGATVGSKGIGRVALMVATGAVGDMITDGIDLGTGGQGHRASS